jgi:hypothetical protein
MSIDLSGRSTLITSYNSSIGFKRIRFRQRITRTSSVSREHPRRTCGLTLVYLQQF